MVKKNYFHNVIRLRKGKPSPSQVYWIIVILNSKKTSSHKQIEQLGFFKHGPKRLFSINYDRLAHFLNKGFKLKSSVLKFIYWHTFLYNKKLKRKKIIKKKIIKKNDMYISNFKSIQREQWQKILQKMDDWKLKKK